ncbi:hypothetical protein P20652_1230 [Pseudoalteromonas sp. BSi20652]|nr:hypothetical protein P20652_1230 [Pseudoalteromonas sp. BSi20652]
MLVSKSEDTIILITNKVLLLTHGLSLLVVKACQSFNIKLMDLSVNTPLFKT